MFDSQTQDIAHRPLKAVPIGHLARDARWSMDAPRSYLVPVLMWFTAGQGRFALGDRMRGYTAHNAIFLPANTAHAVEACGRTQGTALFLGARANLPVPREVLHLRLSAISQQTELNQLVEGFRSDCDSDGPIAEEMRHHRAALIGLWLTRQAMMSVHAGGSVTTVTPPMPAPRAAQDRDG